jgi:transcriptional regulator with XRE-family HTH domain
MIRLRVKEIAKQKGISQLKLGRLADIDAERMRRIFRYGDSKHSNLTLASLDRIAIALQVDASELIESIPDESQNKEGQE